MTIRYLTKILVIPAVLFAAASIHAQAQSKKKQDAVATQVAQATTPPSVSAPSVAIEGDRKLVPQDVLEITLVGEKEIDKLSQRIFAGGTINIPFIEKPVMVAGKTPSTVKEELEAMLKKDYFVNPQIIIRVAEYRKRWITVDGKVMKPGIQELPAEQRVDVLAAIANAGGLAPTAKNKISLTRPGSPVRDFKLDDLRKETDPSKKIYLEPEDYIYIHESSI